MAVPGATAGGINGGIAGGMNVEVARGTTGAREVHYDEVDVGAEIQHREFKVTRGDLVRYAGASGDFNPIHWSERVATEVGLPDVIAHGMLTMGLAARLLTDWTGNPSCVVDYGTRFAKPVVVPDDDEGATVVVSARVAEKLAGRRVRVDLTVQSGGVRVLSQAKAVVQLA